MGSGSFEDTSSGLDVDGVTNLVVNDDGSIDIVSFDIFSTEEVKKEKTYIRTC